MMHIHGGNIYEYEKIADFSANINFRGMPETVREAARAAVDASVHYPEPECRELRREIAKREQAGVEQRRKRRTACEVLKTDQAACEITSDQIICGNGAAELMFALGFAEKPQRALLAEPSFFEYEQALMAVGCEIRHVMLSEENGFRVDGTFAENISNNIDMVILGSPNNPTGQLVEADVLKQILERCALLEVRLVIDESFFDFLSKEDAAKTLECTELIRKYRNLFVIKSFTKMYAMPGLRFGYGVSGDKKMLERMRMMMQPWNVSVPAQMAALAAVKEMDFARETALQVAENRVWMAEQMRKLGWKVFDSCTNYLLFAGPADLRERCLERGFLIRDCSNFRGLKKGYYRICVRSMEENRKLLDVLKRCIGIE